MNCLIFKKNNNLNHSIAGVLWKNIKPYPNAAEVLNTLRDLGKKVFYVTNNSTKTRLEFVEKCEGLNFKAEEKEILCTSNMVAQYLKDLNFDKKVYVVGSKGTRKDLFLFEKRPVSLQKKY